MRGKNPPLFHSFVVFSILDDEENVQEKFAQCNNCGIIHRVYDICKSELTKKESHGAIQTIADISLSLPTELNSILTTYKCDISIWEHVQFIYLFGKWGESAVVSKEIEDGKVNGKRLIIEGSTKFRIEPISYSEVI
jgi:hypothetical protein